MLFSLLASVLNINLEKIKKKGSNTLFGVGNGPLGSRLESGNDLAS